MINCDGGIHDPVPIPKLRGKNFSTNLKVHVDDPKLS
jgi:hypothetical protein